MCPFEEGGSSMQAGQSSRRSRFFKPKFIAAITAVLVAAALAAGLSNASAQSATTVSYTVSATLIGSDGAIGALYQPTSPDPEQSTAFLFSHDVDNLIGSIPCVQLAQRGFTVLCVKSEFTEGALVTWDSLALDVGAGVKLLRGLSTVKHVILVGYSAGGPDMAYYQNVAQNGVATCEAKERLDPCTSALAGLPPADGVVLLDSIPGALSGLSTLDASVVDESNVRLTNEALNMFSTKNGYNPNGPSSYSTAFINRYTKAQGNRMNKLINEAQDLLAKVKNGTGQYTDDAPMLVGKVNARIWQADLNLLSHTKGEFPLISPQHPNGSSPQVVRSVRVVSADPVADSQWDQTDGGFTASTFLSTAALRAPDFQVTADSITGVDWGSSNTSTILNVKGIRSPLLIMAMTGHYWVVPSEMYYNAATSTPSKTLAFVEGASHGLTPCTACATTPGEFGDTVGETFNYIARWAAQHYGA
jgi:hypothetical protein